MKNWKNVVRIGLVSTVLILIMGCATWFTLKSGVDPNDPNAYNDPNNIVLTEGGQKVMSGAEAAEQIAKGVSVFWPPATLIAGGIGAAIAAMRKYKPQIAQAKGEAQQFYVATNALVWAIEKYKKDNPEDWEQKLEPILAKNIDPNGSIEAVIRALRGLPAKT